jgi:ABC-type antimicrobial peptide transport system permease subunit
MVVRQGALLAVIGVVIGIGVGLGVTHSLSYFLFGVSPFDPVTFGAVAVVLLAAGLVATYFPARRATKVDPMIALRAE